MKAIPDETHDPSARSWVESANVADSDFPIQNLPFGVFRKRDGGSSARVGIAIGDSIVDITQLRSGGILTVADDVSAAAEACESNSLNSLMALGARPRRALRRRIFALLGTEASPADRKAVSQHLIPQSDVEMLLPACWQAVPA